MFLDLASCSSALRVWSLVSVSSSSRDISITDNSGNSKLHNSQPVDITLSLDVSPYWFCLPAVYIITTLSTISNQKFKLQL